MINWIQITTETKFPNDKPFLLYCSQINIAFPDYESHDDKTRFFVMSPDAINYDMERVYPDIDEIKVWYSYWSPINEPIFQDYTPEESVKRSELLKKVNRGVIKNLL